MPMRNRDTLKEFFKTGCLPSQDSFSDFIDSMINIRDDGIKRSHTHGFCIVSTGNNDRLLSFFKGEDESEPVWVVDLNSTDDMLCLKKVNNDENNPKNPSQILITPDCKIGIKSLHPKSELDINGTMRCRARIGNFNSADGNTIMIPADGEWHELIGNLSGCNAFEIMAGVGKKRTGKYALMHAIAINIHGNRGKIRYTQSFYMDRNNSIRLKWVGNQKGYRLLIRTMSDYEKLDQKQICIKCTITRLWEEEE